MEVLFNSNHTQKLLRNLEGALAGQTPKSDFEKKRNNAIRVITADMREVPDSWDSSCQINIALVGDNFTNWISEPLMSSKLEHLDLICAVCFRFLLELDLSKKNSLHMQLEVSSNWIFENIDSFKPNAKHQIEYAIRKMPITIFKEMANSESLKSVHDFLEISAKTEEVKDAWTKELSGYEDRVLNLKKSLKKYETAFNFVGLNQGFADLATVKNSEKKYILKWLRVLAGVIILPFLIELSVIFFHIKDLSDIRTGLIVAIFPTIPLTAITIYYFRILLFNYKSIKAQLLQIDLRIMLCKFIQSYAEYSKEIKEKNPNALEQFEKIIFSAIVTDDSNLPSTYDGIEELSKLINAFKA